MPTTWQDSWQNDESVAIISDEQITGLFTGWKRIFRSKMKDEDWDLMTVDIWVIALNDLDITQTEFEQAVRQSLSLSWPPTAPADFVALARSDESEYPDVQTAFEIACDQCGKYGNVQRDWKHDVIRETANRIGWGKLANCTTSYIKHFEKIYKQVIKEHQAGATFIVPKTHRLESRPQKPIDWDSEKGKEIAAMLRRYSRKLKGITC